MNFRSLSARMGPKTTAAAASSSGGASMPLTANKRVHAEMGIPKAMRTRPEPSQDATATSARALLESVRTAKQSRRRVHNRLKQYEKEVTDARRGRHGATKRWQAIYKDLHADCKTTGAWLEDMSATDSNAVRMLVPLLAELERLVSGTFDAYFDHKVDEVSVLIATRQPEQLAAAQELLDATNRLLFEKTTDIDKTLRQQLVFLQQQLLENKSAVLDGILAKLQLLKSSGTSGNKETEALVHQSKLLLDAQLVAELDKVHEDAAKTKQELIKRSLRQKIGVLLWAEGLVQKAHSFASGPVALPAPRRAVAVAAQPPTIDDDDDTSTPSGQMVDDADVLPVSATVQPVVAERQRADFLNRWTLAPTDGGTKNVGNAIRTYLEVLEIAYESDKSEAYAPAVTWRDLVGYMDANNLNKIASGLSKRSVWKPEEVASFDDFFVQTYITEYNYDDSLMPMVLVVYALQLWLAGKEVSKRTLTELLDNALDQWTSSGVELPSPFAGDAHDGGQQQQRSVYQYFFAFCLLLATQKPNDPASYGPIARWAAVMRTHKAILSRAIADQSRTSDRTRAPPNYATTLPAAFVAYKSEPFDAARTEDPVAFTAGIMREARRAQRLLMAIVRYYANAWKASEALMKDSKLGGEWARRIDDAVSNIANAANALAQMADDTDSIELPSTSQEQRRIRSRVASHTESVKDAVEEWKQVARRLGESENVIQFYEESTTLEQAIQALQALAIQNGRRSPSWLPVAYKVISPDTTLAEPEKPVHQKTSPPSLPAPPATATSTTAFSWLYGAGSALRNWWSSSSKQSQGDGSAPETKQLEAALSRPIDPEGWRKALKTIGAALTGANGTIDMGRLTKQTQACVAVFEGLLVLSEPVTAALSDGTQTPQLHKAQILASLADVLAPAPEGTTFRFQDVMELILRNVNQLSLPSGQQPSVSIDGDFALELISAAVLAHLFGFDYGNKYVVLPSTHTVPERQAAQLALRSILCALARTYGYSLFKICEAYTPNATGNRNNGLSALAESIQKSQIPPPKRRDISSTLPPNGITVQDPKYVQNILNYCDKASSASSITSSNLSAALQTFFYTQPNARSSGGLRLAEVVMARVVATMSVVWSASSTTAKKAPEPAQLQQLLGGRTVL